MGESKKSRDELHRVFEDFFKELVNDPSYQRYWEDLVMGSFRRSSPSKGKIETGRFFAGNERPEERTEPFKGWRAWRVRKGKLHSLTRNIPWESPVLSIPEPKVCFDNAAKGTRTVPGEGYGIYSYKTMKEFLLHIYLTYDIVGRVESFGHVVEHEYGYRAQHVVVRDLGLLRQEKDSDTFQSIDVQECFDGTQDLLLKKYNIYDFAESLSQTYDCNCSVLNVLNSYTKMLTPPKLFDDVLLQFEKVSNERARAEG